MEENYNSDTAVSKSVKTSTESKNGTKTTGDSEVQEGTDVEQNQKKSYEKSDEQQEYIQDANNDTKVKKD